MIEVAALLLSVLLALAAASGFAWFFYWLERYRWQGTYLFGCVFGWGVVAGIFANLFLALLVPWNLAFHLETQALEVPRRFLLVAPAIEEGLKALAILAVMLMFRRQFVNLWDAMVYGGVIAAGFAAVQNIFYLYTGGYQVEGLRGIAYVFVHRVVLGGFMTTFCGAAIGAALAWAQSRPKLWQRWHTAITLWTGVYGLRVIRNSLILLLADRYAVAPLSVAGWVDGIAWLVAVAVVILILKREYHWFARYLEQQVQSGRLRPEQAALLRRQFVPARLRIILPLRPGVTCRTVFLFSELAYQQSGVSTNPERAEVYQRIQQELNKLVSQLSQAS